MSHASHRGDSERDGDEAKLAFAGATGMTVVRGEGIILGRPAGCAEMRGNHSGMRRRWRWQLR